MAGSCVSTSQWKQRFLIHYFRKEIKIFRISIVIDMISAETLIYFYFLQKIVNEIFPPLAMIAESAVSIVICLAPLFLYELSVCFY